MRTAPLKLLPLLLMTMLAACTAMPAAHTSRQKTDRQLDLAIDGDGYFILQTPAGGYLFTRAGAMSVSASGEIVNADGYKLMGVTVVPTETNNIIIGPDGSIRTQHAGQTPELAGQIVLARFDKSAKLDRDGPYFIPTDASGDPVTAAPGRKGLGTLIIGALEQP